VSEREPREVEISLVEAMDHRAPVIEEIRRVARVLAVANKALEASGVELVVKASSAHEAAVGHQDLPTIDSLSLDEVAQLVTASRYAELDGVEDEIQAHVFDTSVSSAALLTRVLKYINDRREEIGRITDREPE
jgi:hypothetical protein